MLRLLQAPKRLRNVRGCAEDLLLTCCEGAVAAAGLSFEQIDFFIFNTACAWFASFCTHVLGIDPERTINIYPIYANIGSALALANLYHAAQLDKIRENDLVLIYGFGASSSASATVMRWGEVSLGHAPLNEPDLAVKVAVKRIQDTNPVSLSRGFHI